MSGIDMRIEEILRQTAPSLVEIVPSLTDEGDRLVVQCDTVDGSRKLQVHVTKPITADGMATAFRILDTALKSPAPAVPQQ